LHTPGLNVVDLFLQGRERKGSFRLSGEMDIGNEPVGFGRLADL
jgi:hypothetical protein